MASPREVETAAAKLRADIDRWEAVELARPAPPDPAQAAPADETDPEEGHAT